MNARERGAALVFAMLVAALAATVAVALAAEQQRWFADVGNRRDQVQAQSLALAGVQWARQIMRDDARNGLVDHLQEPWALPLPATPIANGLIEGRIEDAQAGFNLNNLTLDSALGTAEQLRLQRLLAAKGVAPALLGAVVDWIDSDSVARAGGAEDEHYLQASPPALAANAPLLRVAELAAVRGVTLQDLDTLAPFVSALPAGTALNINTAPPEALTAAVPGLEGDTLASFVADRVRKPFATIAEVRTRLPRGISLGDETAFAVGSSYFLVSVRSRQGDAIALARALLKRDGRTLPAVVWQTLE